MEKEVGMVMGLGRAWTLPSRDLFSGKSSGLLRGGFIHEAAPDSEEHNYVICLENRGRKR
jgi:hypothetical protein